MLEILLHDFTGSGSWSQWAPPSRVTWTSPVSVPTQISWGDRGEGSTEVIVPYPHAIASGIATSPSQCCAPAVLPVRSGLITLQRFPRSELRNRISPPRYRVGGPV